jgi:hypothetical protein
MPDSDDLDDPIGFLLNTDDAADRSVRMDDALTELLSSAEAEPQVEGQRASSEDTGTEGSQTQSGEPGDEAPPTAAD